MALLNLKLMMIKFHWMNNLTKRFVKKKIIHKTTLNLLWIMPSWLNTLPPRLISMLMKNRTFSSSSQLNLVGLASTIHHLRKKTTTNNQSRILWIWKYPILNQVNWFWIMMIRYLSINYSKLLTIMNKIQFLKKILKLSKFLKTWK